MDTHQRLQTETAYAAWLWWWCLVCPKQYRDNFKVMGHADVPIFTYYIIYLLYKHGNFLIAMG